MRVNLSKTECLNSNSKLTYALESSKMAIQHEWANRGFRLKKKNIGLISFILKEIDKNTIANTFTA